MSKKSTQRLFHFFIFFFVAPYSPLPIGEIKRYKSPIRIRIQQPEGTCWAGRLNLRRPRGEDAVINQSF